ncbi:MAG: hypothetical protein ACI9XZ_003955 [Alphaproteobacteria bacterium]|jgi:hypothetical protein
MGALNKFYLAHARWRNVTYGRIRSLTANVALAPGRRAIAQDKYTHRCTKRAADDARSHNGLPDLFPRTGAAGAGGALCAIARAKRASAHFGQPSVMTNPPADVTSQMRI